jgi:ketosteroid isomerase-like protein
MDADLETLERLYGRFNARDIDGVLEALHEDVAWANGMEGGHVHGHAAVRAYWTRQWALVSPRVEPVGFHRTVDGAIVAEVRQSVRDLQGRPLLGQTHGLKDKTVGHVFHFRDGKVARFDIQEDAV